VVSVSCTGLLGGVLWWGWQKYIPDWAGAVNPLLVEEGAKTPYIPYPANNV
jgi:hypothetical protein